jgi:hypothetical protein
MRFILDLNQHPNLAQGFDQHQRGMDGFKERREFLRRQIENFEKEIDNYKKEFWDNTILYAKEHKLLPDTYSRDTNCLEFDIKSRQLFMHDKEDHEHEHHPLIEAIFGSISRGPDDGKK